MSYTVTETKNYPQAADAVYSAVKKAISGLEGKIVEEDPSKYEVTARFHKTIHGKVLGDRSRFEIKLAAPAEDSSEMTLVAYPLNAVGEKLMFGARKGVVQTVISWLYAHIDHHLSKN